MTTFVDGIVLTQKYPESFSIRELAGVRSLAYREKGDINRDGTICEEQDVIGNQYRHAWIQGSHSTAIRVKSESGLVSLCGNPGRWSRKDNLFNCDLDGTVRAANAILATQNLPPFEAGEFVDSCEIQKIIDAQNLRHYSGYVVQNPDGTYRRAARVWTLHATRNYVTGSAANAQAVLNWLDSQSVARVKKKRFGKSTVTWGNLNYCQTEAYLKADEMMDHCKGEIEREMMRQNPAYQWSLANGVVRIVVKAAKDYLRDREMTYLGQIDMNKIIQIFEERTEILHRVKCDIEEFDPSMLPSGVATTAAAWLAGTDVTNLLSRATFFRHAKILRDYGIDISEKRNVAQMPIKFKTIEMVATSAPDWYSFERDLLLKVA